MATSKVDLKYSKLTPAQKAEVKATEARVLAQVKLSAANRAKAAGTTAAYAKNLSGNISSMGMAAGLSGKYIDTSEKAGFQSPTIAASNNLLMDMVKDPFLAMRKGALRNNKMYNNPYFKRKFGNALINDASSLNKVNQASGGGGSSTVGYETLGARPAYERVI